MGHVIVVTFSLRHPPRRPRARHAPAWRGQRVSGLKSHGRPGRRVVALAARRVAPHQPPDEQDEAPREAELLDREGRVLGARRHESAILRQVRRDRPLVAAQEDVGELGLAAEVRELRLALGIDGVLAGVDEHGDEERERRRDQWRVATRRIGYRVGGRGGDGGGDARGRGRARRRAAARSRRRGYFFSPAEDAGARPRDEH